MAEAATLPLSATTADQALDALDMEAGEWLLVTGAAGVVGAFAVQLALLRGLRVIAQAGHDGEKTLRELGAEEFVPRGATLSARVREIIPGGADGAIDGANQGIAAMDAVRHGGSFASLLNSAPQARRGISTHNVAYHTESERLAKLSALAGAGRLSLRVAATYPLAATSKAHEALAEGGLRGRVVLVP